MKLAGFVAAGSLAIAPVAAQPGPDISVSARPVATDGVTIVGPELAVTGGWALSSPDRRLGGMSGLLAQDSELLMLSDGGAIVRMNDRPAAQMAASVQALPPHCVIGGRADAEAMALSPDGSALRIGLEGSNGICSVALHGVDDGGRIAMADALLWPRNRGAEAMATLAGQGTLVIGEERLAGGTTHPLVWYAGDPAGQATEVIRMHYLPPAGFKPADSAFLPDGRLLVLNRRFEMPNRRLTSLTVIPAFAVREGAALSGREVMRIDGGAVAANFEGLAVDPRPGGATLWLVSDDNFAYRGTTMLLRLELNDAGSSTPGGSIVTSAR